MTHQHTEARNRFP